MAKKLMAKVRGRLSSISQFRDGLKNAAGVEMVELITTPGPGKKLARENSRNFTTPLLVFPRNDASLSSPG